MWSALALVLLSPLVLGPVAGRAAPPARELLRDTHFQRGFTVWGPEPGKIVEMGKLQVTTEGGEPAWTLAQWSSRYPIASETGRRLASGAREFTSPGKAVMIGRPGTPDADLALGVNGRKEYEDHARTAGQPWVHLLAEQRFADPPRLCDLDRLVFSIDARLVRSEALRTPDYSPNLHAAQFQAFLTVQNLNRSSRDYGQLMWFGIPIYDDRCRTPPAFAQPDGAGLFIYTPAGETYTKESLHDGKWVRIRRDVLPLVLEGLRAAWSRGFLKASQELADYRVSAINVGWEVPGLLDVRMQVRGLSLKAAPR